MSQASHGSGGVSIIKIGNLLDIKAPAPLWPLYSDTNSNREEKDVRSSATMKKDADASLMPEVPEGGEGAKGRRGSTDGNDMPVEREPSLPHELLTKLETKLFFWKDKDEKMGDELYQKYSTRAATSFDNPAKSGFLTKQGKIHKTWRERYFVLESNLLFYFDHPKSESPNGVIDLVGCEVLKDKTRGKNHCFQVSHSRKKETSRTFVFYAKNEEEMRGWISALNSATRVRKPKDGEAAAKAPSPLRRIRAQSLNVSKVRPSASAYAGEVHTLMAGHRQSMSYHVMPSFVDEDKGKEKEQKKEEDQVTEGEKEEQKEGEGERRGKNEDENEKEKEKEEDQVAEGEKEKEKEYGGVPVQETPAPSVPEGEKDVEETMMQETLKMTLVVEESLRVNVTGEKEAETSIQQGEKEEDGDNTEANKEVTAAPKVLFSTAAPASDALSEEAIERYLRLVDEAELKLLAQVEPHGADTGEWKLVKDVDEVLLSKRDVRGSSHFLTRIEGHIRAPPDEIMARIRTLEYDPLVVSLTQVARVHEDMDIVHLCMRAPSPIVSDRDFALLRFKRRNQTTGGWVLGAMSIETSLVPETTNYVRGHVIHSGWVLEPFSGERTESFCTYVLGLDPRGWAPAWLVNMFRTTGMYQSFSQLKLKCEAKGPKKASA